jgi:hypothetical protein
MQRPAAPKQTSWDDVVAEAKAGAQEKFPGPDRDRHLVFY